MIKCATFFTTGGLGVAVGSFAVLVVAFGRSAGPAVVVTGGLGAKAFTETAAGFASAGFVSAGFVSGGFVSAGFKTGVFVVTLAEGDGSGFF